MINNIGYLFMVAALAVSLYGLCVPHIGVRRNNWNLVRSVQYGTILNFFLVLMASLVLLRAFIVHDFSVVFVAQNSSTDMPLGYLITAFWGGMDGSLLFWELVLAGFSAFVAFAYQRSNREVIPYVLTTLNGVHVFLLSLLVSYSNPLATQAPIPMDGRGLNPLLQHPAMAAHPPLLYLGYIAFSVPFAFAIGSLVRGRMDNEWVLTTRRWTLFAWFALTAGQMMGGQWAYEELGWGGYWGWDPVENASLMPWLTGTAFLHSVILQEKRGMMKVWNVVLIILTFALSILGTFIVRSGVLNSVHAFAQSEVGPAFLVFLAIVLVISFVLLFRRLRLLSSRHTADDLTSRETAFLLNNLLFTGICFTVFLGTVFPLAAEALRGTKLSIQAPFFNAISAPLGIALLFLMGIATLLAWRHSSLDFLIRNFRVPVALGVVAAGLGLLLGVHSIGALVIFAGAGFTGSILLIDFGKTVRVRMRQQQAPLLTAMGDTVSRNRQRWGGALIHLGVVLLFIGLAGNYLGTERTVTVRPGEVVDFGGYSFRYTGLQVTQKANATLRGAGLDVYRGEDQVATLAPARSFYPTQPDPLTEVAIHRTLAEDLYVVLVGENTNGSVTLRIRINPLVAWLWASLPLFTIGTLVCMFYVPRRLADPAVERRLGLA